MGFHQHIEEELEDVLVDEACWELIGIIGTYRRVRGPLAVINSGRVGILWSLISDDIFDGDDELFKLLSRMVLSLNIILVDVPTQGQ